MTDVQVQDLIPEQKPIKGGRLKSFVDERETLKGKRFIFTVAQNNTKLHDEFWATLTRMAKVRKAKLFVSQCTYNKKGWQRITRDSLTVDGTHDTEGLWYDARIEPHVLNEQVKVAEGLLFCGELDILPTAVTPLSGLSNYSGPHSAIVPHVKMQMESLATMKHNPAKFMYTTGAVTMRNYINRRAGQIAEFHHVYGAVYVEVDKDGRWYARQLNADENGVVFDLDRAWGPTWDAPSKDFGRPALVLGDVHYEKRDASAMIGAMDMIDRLKPTTVFLHDLIDFKYRNHHNIKDPHFLFTQAARGEESVEHSVIQVADWLWNLAMKFPKTEFVVVKSNHDEALDRWLKDSTAASDPHNALYWHNLNVAVLQAIKFGNAIDPLRFAIECEWPHELPNVQFLSADESYVINGIEYGMHGHYGPNGARGSAKNFRQIGVRVCHGHTHSAGIIDGIYTAGVLGSLDMGYNKGPSSWSHSHILSYSNGKRTIITQQSDGRWKA